MRFKNNLQEQTGINTAKLQHSLSAIPSEAASLVARQLLELFLGDPEDATAESPPTTTDDV